LWPPLKLNRGKPVHFAAGAGNPAVRSGAKSNEGMAAVIQDDSTPKRRAVRTLRSKL
jgi:hypothetical protein